MVCCEPTEFNAKINNDDAPVKGYEVILEDTIIFPEGGGQVKTASMPLFMSN